MADIRCIPVQGFKWHDPRLGRNLLLQPGVEITMPEDEYKKYHAQGLVRGAEEVEKAIAEDSGERMALLREHFGREPTPKEVGEWSRIDTDKLGEALAVQRKSQAEWDATKAQRLKDKEERENLASQAEIDRARRVLARSKERNAAEDRLSKQRKAEGA